METKNEELTLGQKIKIIGTMSLVALAVVAGTAGTVVYQRNAKAEAAALLQKQIAAVMAKKAILPLYKDTKEFKEIEEKTMVKVNQSELPKTITAELTSSECYEPLEISPGTWSVSKDGSVVAYYTIAGESAGTNDFTHAGDWAVNDGSISVPSAEYGTYTYSYLSSTVCHPDFNPDAVYYVMNHYTFKIVPPCPTSVTLTH